MAISADKLCDGANLDDRLKRAIDAIAAEGGKPFRSTGRSIVPTR